MLRAMQLIVACVPVLIVSGQVQGAVVYSQSTLTTSDRGAYQYFGQELADDFSVSANAVVNVVNWQGSYYGTDAVGTESFTINFYVDNAGLPSLAPFFSQVVLVNVVDSGTDLLGKNLYNYSANISGAALSVGVTYWISAYTNDNPANYAWANSSDGTSDGALRNSGGSWIQLDNDVLGRSNHVFSLESTVVPEPASLALCGIGMLGMTIGAACRRRRAKSR